MMKKNRALLVVLGLTGHTFVAQEVVIPAGKTVVKTNAAQSDEEIKNGCFHIVRAMMNTYLSAITNNDFGIDYSEILLNQMIYEWYYDIDNVTFDITLSCYAMYFIMWLSRVDHLKKQQHIKRENDAPAKVENNEPQVPEGYPQQLVAQVFRDTNEDESLLGSLVYEGGLELFGGGGQGLYKQTIDPALEYRTFKKEMPVDDAIELLLPGFEERAGFLKLYRDVILLDPGSTEQFMQVVKTCLSDEVINDIASKTEGFSGGELESIITTLVSDAPTTEDGLISAKLVDSAVQQTLDKHSSFAIVCNKVAATT